MGEMEIKRRIQGAFEDVGIFFDFCDGIDMDLTNLFEDSIQFISFIVRLEEVAGVEIPDDLLLIDKFKSIDMICNVISVARELSDING